MGADEEQFDAEFRQAQPRFFSLIMNRGAPFRLHDAQGNTMLPHVGLAGSFEAWKEINSPWDRRHVMFDALLEMLSHQMETWQTAVILAASRFFEEALDLLAQDDDPAGGGRDFAMARVLIGMTMYRRALTYARSADRQVDHDLVRVTLADASFLTGDHETSAAIYTKLMTDAGSSETTDIDVVFKRLFALDTGAAPSPVLALQIGRKLNNPAQRERFWAFAEAEFYDSPHFRAHHAYELIRVGETQRGIAKLAALVQEMWWTKEAHETLLKLLQRFDPSGDTLVPEIRATVEQRLREQRFLRDD